MGTIWLDRHNGWKLFMTGNSAALTAKRSKSVGSMNRALLGRSGRHESLSRTMYKAAIKSGDNYSQVCMNVSLLSAD